MPPNSTPKLKLVHKGLLLVALPLCLQGGLYLGLKDQLIRAEEQARTQELSKQIVSLVDTLLLDSANMFGDLIEFCFNQDTQKGERIARLSGRIGLRLDRLCDLLRDKAKQPTMAQRIAVLGKRFLDESAKVKENWPKGQTPLSFIQEFNQSVRFRDACSDLARALDEVAASERGKVVDAYAQEQAFRARFANWLDIAVALNAGLALALMIFFMRGTVRHLEVLKQNATLVAEDKPLLPPIQGSDEIAQVDSVFHEMAASLATASETLKASEDRLKAIIDVMPIALIICHDGGIIESLNPTAEALFLYESRQVGGTHIDQVVKPTPADRKAGLQLSRLLAECAGKPVKMEGLSKEEEIIPIEVSFTRFETLAGKRILATVVDITESYKLDELKRQFVAMVSHDIRTPLTSIRSILELARFGKLGQVSEEAKQRLGQADENVQRLLTMVKKLLDLEKLDAGMLDLSFSTFSLKELVREALNVVAPLASQQSVNIKMEIDDVLVKADREMIAQVLTNILANAVRHSPANADVILSLDDLAQSIKVNVTDVGEGVPKRMQEEIFERFKQAGKQSQGFGLGLAICKSIILQHKETIGVDSEEGKGSTFWFTLAKG